MKITKAILFATILFASVSAVAQRADVFGGYSYLNFSPTVTGLDSRNFNGGGGAFDLYFLKILGIKADFMYYGNTTFTRTVPVTIVIPGSGIIPAGTYSAEGNMFTYMGGPLVRIPTPLIKPFGEVLFGASSTDGYSNLARVIHAAGGTLSISSQHPFTLAAGGGVDITISHWLAIRPAEFDYVLTKYSNPLTNNSSQNNFRYCGGVVLKF